MTAGLFFDDPEPEPADPLRSNWGETAVGESIEWYTVDRRV